VTVAVIVAGVGFAAFRGLGLWARMSPDAILEKARAHLRDGRYDRVDVALDRLSRLREPTPLD